MSSFQANQLDCGGQVCRYCGKCCDWTWDESSCGCCSILGARKVIWKRRGESCRYGDGDVYHNTLRDGSYHSLCICDKK